MPGGLRDVGPAALTSVIAGPVRDDQIVCRQAANPTGWSIRKSRTDHPSTADRDPDHPAAAYPAPPCTSERHMATHACDENSRPSPRSKGFSPSSRSASQPGTDTLQPSKHSDPPHLPATGTRP